MKKKFLLLSLAGLGGTIVGAAIGVVAGLKISEYLGDLDCLDFTHLTEMPEEDAARYCAKNESSDDSVYFDESVDDWPEDDIEDWSNCDEKFF